MDDKWENRVLCSDESCVGTIGPDGRCRYCKKPYEGRLPENFGEDINAASNGEDDPENSIEKEASVDQSDIENNDNQDDPDAENDDDGIDDDWENRILCSDESCVGTVGKNGRCRVCGLKYKK